MTSAYLRVVSCRYRDAIGQTIGADELQQKTKMSFKHSSIPTAQIVPHYVHAVCRERNFERVQEMGGVAEQNKA